MSAFEKIEAQRKGKEFTDVWMVGQQLLEILRSDPSLEEIVDKDLDVPKMSLAHCAKKIKAWADEQHKKQTGNCVCVPPDIAERIIREFYGLPELNAENACYYASNPFPTLAVAEDDPLDFSTFL